MLIHVKNKENLQAMQQNICPDIFFAFENVSFRFFREFLHRREIETI